MIETLHPVLPKTPVLGLRCHIGKSGLCIGDAAHLHLTETGDVTLTELPNSDSAAQVLCEVVVGLLFGVAQIRDHAARV